MMKMSLFKSVRQVMGRMTLTAVLATLCLAPVAQSVVVAATNENGEEEQEKLEVIDRFIDHIGKLDSIDSERRDAVTQLVTELRNDEFSNDFAITEGLAGLYPEFSQALEALGNDELSTARELLTTSAESSDKFLAADATYFLARSAIFGENYESALPMLDRVTTDFADYSIQKANSLFFKGMAESALLKRTDAVATLNQFLEKYPNASERMRVSAMRRVQELQMVEDGSLFDVYERMDYSRRHLQLEKTGVETQTQQDEIVKILDKLIKKIEDQECKNCNSNCNKPGQSQGQKQGKGQGQGQSQSGAGSQNPDGYANRTFGTGPTSPWSDLRERSRDPAFTAIKEKYPARYQKIIEQYYKSFQTNGTN